MHFHLPKPLHGWRALAGEVGIIVLGVLIALGAQQVVEAWEWRQKVGVVRKSLMGELGNDRARWELDVAQMRCTLPYIDALDRWAKAGGSGAPPKSRSKERGGIMWMHSANWTLATGSATLDHFPIDEQLAFAALYDGLAHREVNIEIATDLIGKANTLMPLATDEQGRRELQVALGNVRMRYLALLSDDGYMRRHFDALGVKADRSDFAADVTNVGCGAISKP